MKGGFLTRWYSKLVKFPWFLRGQMRRRSSKIRHTLGFMKNKIYKEIPDKVLIKHRVTTAMKDQIKVGKKAKKAEAAEYVVGFDNEILETLTLKELQAIENKILAHERQHGPTGYEEQFGTKILEIMAIAEQEDRKDYFRYLEPIIRVAEKSGDHKALMEQIRLLGPSQTNLFSAIAMRLDIRVAGRGVSKLRADKKGIQRALAQWDVAKGDKRKQSLSLGNAFAQAEINAQATLHNDALVAKRDFLLALLTLKYINDDEGMMKQYYERHVMPSVPEHQRITEFEELKHEFAEDMHVLAQGMRRIFSMEQEIDMSAKQIIAESRARRARAA